MQLLGKAQTPEFWQQVKTLDCHNKYRTELLEIWNKRCENMPICALKYSDFKQYFVTGSRAEYEETYFARRQALASSALLAMIFPEEEKYLARLMDEIYTICDEYTWCLPAHQKPNLETNNNIHIDLFAAETSFALSEVDSMQG